MLSKKFNLYTLELISSKYSKFLHSVEGEGEGEGENPPFSSCMDLAIKNSYLNQWQTRLDGHHWYGNLVLQILCLGYLPIFHMANFGPLMM